VRLRQEPETVYNLEVEGDHCYRVGQQGLLVHDMSALNPNIKVTSSPTSATTFRTEDGNDSDFFIFGTVGNGVLKFEVVRKLPNKTSTITGREFFDAMWAHLGSKVKVIEGSWDNTNPQRVDNLKRFNQATANPKVPLETAALVATRTGQWADDLGYSKVTFILLDPDPQTGPNARGHFTKVIVYFSM
jgi:hypothetical protein